MSYPIAIRAEARQHFMLGYSIQDVWKVMRAKDGCETIRPKTIERWCSEEKWVERRKEVQQKAVIQSDEAAMSIIGQCIEENDEVRKILLDELVEKAKNKDVKTGTAETIAYAINVLQKAKIDMTGAADRLQPKTQEAEEVTRTFRGEYIERVRRAKASG